MAGRHGSAAFKIIPTMHVLGPEKNYVLFLGRVSDLGRTVAMGTIKPTLGLFFCLLLKPFV